MENVLVTGATGFIGSHLVDTLLNAGYSVVATSRSEEKARRMAWFSRVTYVPFDISNISSGIHLFESFQRPDRIIHLAWDGLPNYKSLHHFENNLINNYFFLKSLIFGGCTDVTVVGTCLEYGMKSGRLSESLTPEPVNAYALAKDALRRFLLAFSKECSFALKWIRMFYLFGEGQNPNSLFAQLERAIADDKKTFDMSGGEQVRDFLPVERASNYLMRIATQAESGVFNCCSGQPVKVKDFVEKLLRSKGANIALNLGAFPYVDYEPMEFWGDNTKLQTILNGK